MTECKKYTVNITQQLDPTSVVEALQKCSRLRDTGEPPVHLGKGAFGVVYGFVIRKKNRLGVLGSPKNVAIKMQVIKKGKLKDFIKEAQYAAELGDKGISPKVYSAFYYNIQNNRASRLRGSGKAIGIIVMERFQMSCFDALIHPPQYIKTRYIQQMIIGMFNIIDRMLKENIYCSDIKPGNFVVNFIRRDPLGFPTVVNIIDVALIDFSAAFCKRQAPHYIQTIKAQAKRKLFIRKTDQGDVDKIPGWKKIHEATSQANPEYSKTLYGNILKIALILNINRILKNKYADSIRKTLLYTFYNFLNHICNSDAILENITESLVNERWLYITFMHNIMVPREIEDAPRIEWREHIIAQLKKLCDIKRHLDDVPPAKKKVGVTAKLKRAFRPRGGRRKKKHYTRKQRRHRYKKRKTRRR